MAEEKILGIDLGGTKIGIGMVQQERILDKVKVDTEGGEGPEKVLNNLVSGIGQLGKDYQKVGVAIAGQVDTKKGDMAYSPNLPGFEDFSLVKELKKRLGDEVEIRIENDANCFALAESKYGAGKGYNSLVVLTLGTGVGSGIVIDGKLIKGLGFASEIGHMYIREGGEKCSCGARGHLEAYASGRSIERTYRDQTNHDLLAHDIEKLALEGDAVAARVYRGAGEAVGIGLVNVVNILDPETIILGGGIGRSDMIFQTAEKVMKERAFFRRMGVVLQKSKLSDRAGILGAAMLFDQKRSRK